MYPPKYLLYSFLAYSLLTLTFYFLPHIMDIFIKIVQFVLSLSILVLFHEFGHFLFAKLFKTRVEKFYMFFNPWFSLFKFKKGETEYGVGWLPLGGYVKIAGMIDESMDTEQMKQPARGIGERLTGFCHLYRHPIHLGGDLSSCKKRHLRSGMRQRLQKYRNAKR